MTCLRPITIPYKGIPNRPYLLRAGLHQPDHHVMTVPCGKCIECVRSRQDSIAVRCVAEANKRGSMVFVTLTYDDKYLPLTSTLCKVNADTGEFEMLTSPQFVASSSVDDYLDLRDKFSKVRAGQKPRYLDFDIPEFDEFDKGYHYFYRVTPSVCRDDVRLWLKRCRVRHSRLFGGPLPDFTYMVCQEYGPKTCRPHYHLVFFGLSEMNVYWLCEQWKFGFYKVQEVKKVNKDGTSGFDACANYVGKYISKGVFECESVKDCFAQKPRVMSSKGIGDNLINDGMVSYMCGFDLFGKFDIDSLRFAESGRCLSKIELAELIKEIPKRLVFSTDGKHYYAFPRLLRNKIFYVKESVYKDGCEIYRPSRLWALVSDAIQREFAMLREREFQEFLSRNSERSIDEVVASYESSLQNTLLVEEDARIENLRQFYQKSVSPY